MSDKKTEETGDGGCTQKIREKCGRLGVCERDLGQTVI